MELVARRAAPKVPVHIWIVGLLALALNTFGCFQFVMINLRDPAYIAPLPSDMIDYIDALPAWTVICWAMAVGFGWLGALALLARSRHAVSTFALALLGLAAAQAHQFAVGTPIGMNTAGAWGVVTTIWIVKLAQWIYAMRWRRRDVLR